MTLAVRRIRQGRYLSLLLVLSDPREAAVILVASSGVLHARVDDAAHRDVHVVGAQVLQQVDHLTTLRLQHDFIIIISLARILPIVTFVTTSF